ncbi:MAG: SpoIIIAC/SpoIIIAD family protein [Porcipelethomonas sp.]
MVSIISVCVICICAALICKITEKHSKEQAVLLVTAVSALILINVVSEISPVMEKIESLASASGLDSIYAETIFKALGICFLTKFASDICRDCNENSMASAAEIAGKLQLLLLALPMFGELADMTAVMLE